MIGRLVYLLILCSNVKYAFSQDPDFNYKCIESNATITYTKICDGNRDCFHGSEETAVQCKYDREKNEDEFHCANGAVVSSNARCNGVKMECADNSDEATNLCWDDLEDFERNDIYELRRGECPEDQWQCPTESELRCIHQNQTCDNVYDCSNGWDESVDICMRDCLENEFQCGNGVCIKKTQMCDSNLDCIDGTDELPITCQENIDINNIESVFCSEPTELHLQFSNETQFYLFNVNTTKFVYPNMGVRFVCQNPKISIERNQSNVCLTTGKWLRALPHCERNMDPKTNGTMGCPIDTYAKYNTTLKIYECNGKSDTCEKITEPPFNDKIFRFECKEGYNLLPDVKRATCMNKTWTYPKDFKSPRCVKFCNPEELYCLDSIKPECKDENGVAVDCMNKKKVPPKFTATLGCNFGFKNVNALKVTCLEDGTWENISNISNACKFDCQSPGGALTKNAAKIKIDKEKSVVFIYEDVNRTSNFSYSCAGNIVRPNVVITAAHCVFNRTEEALRVIRDEGKSYIKISDGWAVEKIFYPAYDDITYSLDVGILQLELKHSGDEMSNAICLPSYKNDFYPNYSVQKGEFDALETLDNDTNSLGKLTMVTGNVINSTDLEYEVKLLLNRRLCQGDSGTGFLARCNGIGTQKCLYGVLSHSTRSTDGVNSPCAHSVVVSRIAHRLVMQFIISTLEQIENKCAK